MRGSLSVVYNLADYFSFFNVIGNAYDLIILLHIMGAKTRK